MIRINDRFQFELDKMTYTFSHFKRDALIDEIDRYTKTLDRFLLLQDGISIQAFSPVTLTRSRDRMKHTHSLVFWKHADCVFRLMRTAWQCACASIHCAHLPLHQNEKDTSTCLDLLVKYSSSAQNSYPWSSLSLTVNHTELPISHTTGATPSKRRRIVRFGPSDAVLQGGGGKVGGATDAVAAMFNSAPTITLPGALAPANIASNSSTRTGKASTDEGLCSLLQKSCVTKAGACICTLIDSKNDSAYGLFRTDTLADVEPTYTLREILQGQCSPELYHGPRLSIAHAITRSFLRLYTTPWLNESAMSTSICVPVTPDGKRLLHEQAFLHSHFEHTPNSDDKTFALLGILLLELCYNRPLECHPRLKQRPEMKTDYLVRNAVAIEWARDVEYVWGVEGAQAIGWCLHSASSRHEGWRADFATNVVEPLRTLSVHAGSSKCTSIGSIF